MQDLLELAANARFAVSDLFEDDEEYDHFLSLPPVEQIVWRYCHSDCDDFALALHRITTWPVVSVSSRSKGPLHRLVVAPDGRFLDACGWATIDQLQQRYKSGRLSVSRPGDEGLLLGTTLEDAPFEDLEHRRWREILSTIMQIPTDPFLDEDFQSKVNQYASKIGITNL